MHVENVVEPPCDSERSLTLEQKIKLRKLKLQKASIREEVRELDVSDLEAEEARPPVGDVQ